MKVEGRGGVGVEVPPTAHCPLPTAHCALRTAHLVGVEVQAAALVGGGAEQLETVVELAQRVVRAASV